eukprot:GHVT01010911.1.p1 GENE.GHVT01010911.1~~GHVT01010911.1.p1  ORF type:complete len:121 (-),score=14.83 GHVT01010911.1:224-586(-)
MIERRKTNRAGGWVIFPTAGGCTYTSLAHCPPTAPPRPALGRLFVSRFLGIEKLRTTGLFSNHRHGSVRTLAAADFLNRPNAQPAIRQTEASSQTAFVSTVESAGTNPPQPHFSRQCPHH